jgi:hypothetical protein
MDDTKISSEKKLTLLLLWLLVGIFGVHRFYTGKSISGMIQVLNLGLMILLITMKSDLSLDSPASYLWVGGHWMCCLSSWVSSPTKKGDPSLLGYEMPQWV